MLYVGLGILMMKYGHEQSKLSVGIRLMLQLLISNLG